MCPILAPDHLFKILIRRDNDPLLIHGPLQDVSIAHRGTTVADLGNVMTHLRQPFAQSTTGIYIC
jgi:hypothetical protein